MRNSCVCVHAYVCVCSIACVHVLYVWYMVYVMYVYVWCVFMMQVQYYMVCVYGVCSV